MKLSDDAAAAAERMRLDKWLWAARFYKTRSLAAQAVEGGKVRLNGQRVKPAKDVKVGDELKIQAGDLQWAVEVRGLMQQRRSAPEAQALYEERAESKARRAEQIVSRKQFIAPLQGGRPTKRDRRMIRRFTEE